LEPGTASSADTFAPASVDPFVLVFRAFRVIRRFSEFIEREKNHEKPETVERRSAAHRCTRIPREIRNREFQTDIQT